MFMVDALVSVGQTLARDVGWIVGILSLMPLPTPSEAVASLSVTPLIELFALLICPMDRG